jgi:O-Antigen ligase/Tetratricopeptide repeat
MSVIPRPREVRPAEPPPRPKARIEPAVWWTSGALALAVFWTGYENGSSGLSARTVIAIGIWWAILVGVGLGFLPRERASRGMLVVGALLAAFAVHTFASVFWAPSAAAAFNEFDRAALYLGLFLLVAMSIRRTELDRWANGLWVGLVAIAVVALISRLFPDLFSPRGLPEYLPNTATRLSFPIGYWNGLGILMGMTVPLCLRTALTESTPLRRSLGVAAIPILACVVYFTSSRGGVVTGLVGTIVFLAATSRRWEALGAAAAGGIGSAVAVAVLVPRTELVNGPLSSNAAHSQGRVAAALVLGCCLLSAAAYLVGARILRGRPAPSPLVGKVVLAGALLALVVAVVALHPVRRFETFKRIPTSSSTGGDFVRSHLLSGNGSGRWQFWSAAVDEFRSAPLAGQGAASYEPWWAQHATFTHFIRNAHSLYLETLAELGVIGLILIGGAFVAGGVIAVRRLIRAGPRERPTIAALTAVFAAFALAAAIDWVWQITAIAAVAIVALALVVGSEVERPKPVTVVRERGERSLRFALGAAALACAWVVICAQAIPWLASIKLSASQAAVRSGDGDDAFNDAADAKRIQPWAASPYLQLALVEEASGHLAAARSWIGEAIERDRENWRLWLVAARLETKAGDIAKAEQTLERAASLNPRSPLFADVGRR